MNAIPKPKYPESIFDHNPTQGELDVLFFGCPETQAEYFEVMDQDGCMADLAVLYRVRGDEDAANRFISKVSDPRIRMQFRTRPCCAGHSWPKPSVSP